MGATAISSKHRFCIAKQTAEESVAANAEFQIPIYSGIINPVEARGEHEATDTLDYRRGDYKQSAAVEGSVVVPSLPSSIGRLVQAHLGTDTISGAADPYLHTITKAATPPWVTAWVARPTVAGGYEWDRFEDCFIKALEFQIANGMVVKAQAEFLGKKAKTNVSAPTITTTEVLDSTGPWHHMAGATLDLDLDATPGASQVRNIQSGTIRFGYEQATLLQTDELTPRYRDLGLWSLGCSLDTVHENYEAYRATYFGSKSAADAYASQTVVRGALDFTFPVGAVANADRTLQIQLPSLQFSLTPAAVDVSGASVKAQLTAKLQHPGSGEPATVLVKNATSTAY